MNTLRASLLVAGLIGLGGCKKDEPAAAPAAAPKPSMLTLSGHGKGGPAAAPAGDTGGLHGTVAERLDAPNYTYLRLTTAQGDTWAAVPTTPVAVGTEVTIANPMPMQNFESKTLNRKFDVIMFGASAELGNAAAPAGAPPAAMGGAPVMPAPSAAAVDLANIKVAKAPGADGRTVAETYAQRVALKDKTILVHGKVVKVTSGVMGKNWLHLRDGSGSEDKKNNDLTVTTDDVATLGSVVLVQGIVHTDKDLGSGYNFSVIVEDAKVTKE
jgi:hypothetical protein